MPAIEVRSSAAGQAQLGLEQQTLQVGLHTLRLNATMSMLANQEAVYHQVKADPSLVGAEPDQPLGEIHEMMISLYALVYRDAKAVGLTPYTLSEAIPMAQMSEIVSRMQALVGQLPGADEGNDQSGNPASR